MNTPAHIIVGAALFSQKGAPRITAAAVTGAMLPDLSLYLLAGISLMLLQIPPERVFNELYFSSSWQTIFAVDNSLILWGGLMGLALWKGHGPARAFSGAGLAHIALDLPLHHDDGRAHFWPLTDWVFQSPVSYWDSHHHAGLFAPLGGALIAVLTWVLWQRFPAWPARVAFLVLLAAEIWVIRQWILFF